MAVFPPPKSHGFGYQKVSRTLEQLQSYRRAGLGIGKGVMVVCKVKSACGSNRLELMIGKAQPAAGSSQGVVENVIRIIHPIDSMNRLEAALVKASIVCNQRKTFNLRDYASPYLRKYRRILSVLRSQPVNPPAEPLVILRFRVNEGIERI